jgi:hypothetical protein
VVTNRRLLLGPLDVGLAEEILEHVLGKAGVSDLDFAESILSKYGPRNPRTVWLRHVTDVQPVGASWRGGPGLMIRTDTDEEITLRIVHKPRAFTFGSKNGEARDTFIQVLREAVAAAKTVAPPSGSA